MLSEFEQAKRVCGFNLIVFIMGTFFKISLLAVMKQGQENKEERDRRIVCRHVKLMTYWQSSISSSKPICWLHVSYFLSSKKKG